MKFLKLISIALIAILFTQEISIDIDVNEDKINGLNIMASQSKIDIGYSFLLMSYKNNNRERVQFLHDFTNKGYNSFLYTGDIKPGREYNFYLNLV